MALQTHPTLSPTVGSDRVEIVDILRGFALLGIVIVNMGLIGVPVYGLAVDMADWPGQPNQAAEWLIRVFAEGKFYPLFSFLFGWGLAAQMRRAEAQGVPFVPLYLRRLAALLLIGVVHAVLFWEGDILVIYALLGALLLLFRHRSRRTILLWAVMSLLAPVVIMAGLAGLVQWGVSQGAAAGIDASFAETITSMQQAAAQATAVYAGGSYGAIVAQHIRDLTFLYPSMLFFFMPTVFGMFLLGLLAGREGLFHDVPAHLRTFRRLAVWGLSLGLLGSVTYTYAQEVSNRAVPGGMSVLVQVGGNLGGPLLSLGYVGAIVLLAQQASWLRRLEVFAPVGRMALSNYLAQSVFYLLVFTGVGLGLYGVTGPAIQLLLAVALYAAQAMFSAWWLARFRFGPAEWLWRTLTYGRRQPMRRAPTPVAA